MIRRRILRSVLSSEPTDEVVLTFALGLASEEKVAHAPAKLQAVSLLSDQRNDKTGHRETFNKLIGQLRRAVRLREFEIANELENNIRIVETEERQDIIKNERQRSSTRSMTPARSEGGASISRIKLFRGRTEVIDTKENSSDEDLDDKEWISNVADSWAEAKQINDSTNNNNFKDDDDDDDRNVVIRMSSDDHGNSHEKKGKKGPLNRIRKMPKPTASRQTLSLPRSRKRSSTPRIRQQQIQSNGERQRVSRSVSRYY